MIRIFHLVLLLSFFVVQANAQHSAQQNLWAQADSLLQLKDAQTEARQQALSSQAAQVRYSLNHTDSFSAYRQSLRLAHDYAFFIQDSAFAWGITALKLANALHRNDFSAEARTHLAHVLLLKGLFKEAADSLDAVNPQLLDTTNQIDYYSIAYRCYFDLASSRPDYFKAYYLQRGQNYCSQLYKVASPRSYSYLVGKALEHLATHQQAQAQAYYRTLLDSVTLSQHQQAVVYHGLGFLEKPQNPQQATLFYLQATLADLQSLTKETAASTSLAESLFGAGQVEQAYKFILNARNDAQFYGSHQRQLEIGRILPRIEAERFAQLRQRNHINQLISILSSIALAVILAAALHSYWQIRRLRKARHALEQANRKLHQLNTRLAETSHIKEEYIGYYLGFATEFVGRLDSFKRSVLQRLVARQFERIQHELSQFDPQAERERIFANFDRIFLSIFPEFIHSFNQLLQAEYHYKTDTPNTLNTDLRIYALMRLGISQTERIAQILGLSVNTIYAYKTRIKKRALSPTDGFETQILSLPSGHSKS